MKRTSNNEFTLSELYLLAQKVILDRSLAYIPITEEWADPQKIAKKIYKSISDHYKRSATTQVPRSRGKGN